LLWPVVIKAVAVQMQVVVVAEQQLRAEAEVGKA